jgi:putative ABC transport system ATP-binding protein
MIAVEKLTKTFNPGGVNEVRAVDDLSLEIPGSQVVTVIGSNGSGKSTLLSLIAGTHLPEAGRIVINGQEVTKRPEHRRAGLIGRVFQDPMRGTSAAMTIEENLSLAVCRGRRRGLGLAIKRRQRQKLRDRLARLGLGLEDRLTDRVGLLSGGQRQALTMLMATLVRPKVLLLDEHTSALDPKTAALVTGLTGEIIAAHCLTAIVVTHNMDQAIRFGERLIMMNQGQIILDVSGREKDELTVARVMEHFSRVRGEVYADDAMLLT